MNRISFIGHSLGGLIIRACLPELEKFSRKMWAFVTLSSPHLGYLYSIDFFYRVKLNLKIIVR